MTTSVAFGNLASEGAEFAQVYREAIERVLKRGWFILGEEVRAFEREYAAWLGVGECVGCASGTDALTLALKALDVGRGDEVITAANTCGPTIVGIENTGARVRLVDADPDTLMLDPNGIEAAISSSTRAIVPVHLYGSSSDMDALVAIARRYQVRIVEDCAQSHGSTFRGRKTGTFGEVNAFSFYPSKNLGAVGDGGACVTNDPEVAERLRRLRNYGQSSRYSHVERGLNSRLDEVQAAILRAKLPRLDEMNRRRQTIAVRYREALASCPDLRIPSEPAGARSVHHLFVVMHPRRDALQAFLSDRGIETYIHYPVPIHLQPAYRDLGYSPGAFPVAERAGAELLSLPMYPWLDAAAVDVVTTAVREFCAGKAPA